MSRMRRGSYSFDEQSDALGMPWWSFLPKLSRAPALREWDHLRRHVANSPRAIESFELNCVAMLKDGRVMRTRCVQRFYVRNRNITQTDIQVLVISPLRLSSSCSFSCGSCVFVRADSGL